ncbi:glycosyltransferase family 4 protein [Enterovirga sp. CN4-39]|uniref:glycosyltransferase family 4 protein n=1 Tax=Enterovirga sp. CN4-39 TaxID=3400910 RepID=UPI003C1254D2
MRILLANTGHPATIKGGAEAAVLDLGHALVARGHHVALAVHHAGAELEESDDGGVRVYALPNRNLYFGFDGRRRPAPLRLAWHGVDSANPLMARAFGEILDREKPDLLNTHVVVGLSQLVWREARRRGVPIVHYLHEYGTMCPRGSAFRDGHLCKRPCASCSLLTRPRKRLSALVNTVVGVSRFTLQRHLDWGFFPNARQAVLPNIFHGLSFRGRAPAKSGPLRLGYFGRLIPDKGAHVLLQALQAIPAESWTLDIAGTGDETYIEQLKREAGRNVRFLGWTGAAPFFAGIDVLVVPSIWPDPQPRVIFEAFSHGVPVLGSSAGGIPEQIDEGETGWLFDAGSVESLAAAAATLAADRSDRRIRPASLERRLARLAPERVIAEYERVYQEASGVASAPSCTA